MLKAGWCGLVRLARASAVLCIVGAISAAGCGGKTDTAGGFGEGGGEAGTSGTSGTSGKGGTGSGKGGAAGTAGKGTGGKGGGGGVTPEQIIRDICAELAARNCVAELGGESECISNLSEQRDVAAVQGCTAEFDAALECIWTNPPPCRNGEPQTSARCEAESLAVTRCANPGSGETCSRSGGGSGGAGGGEFCSMDCSNYGVQCQRQSTNQPLVCQCTFGPNAGFTFNHGACEQGLTAGQSICRG